MPGTVAVVTVVAGVVTGALGVAAITAAVAMQIAVGFWMAVISMALSYVMQPDTPSLGGMGGMGGASDKARERLRNIKQPLSPHRVIYGKTRVGGTITYLHTTDSDEELHQLITIAGHSIDAVESIYGDDKLLTLDGSQKVTNEKWANQLYVWSGLGTTSTDSSLLSAMVSNTDGSWTTAHKQENRSKIYCQYIYDRDAYGSALPGMTFIVRGKKVYDPRDTTTAYSNNAALCILDYLRDSGYGLGEPDTRIDMASFITAANISDENVTLAGGGTEKRYVCNGTFETSEKPSRILKDLLSTCSGRLTYQGGKWALRVGAYVSPTITFTEDDIEGTLEVISQVGRRNLFNQVQSVYTSALDLYQPTDAPLIKNATYLAEDQSEVITGDMEYPFTTAASTSQRLAKIELERVRQQISVVTTFSLRQGFKIQAGDTIGLTNTRMGWTNKAFVVEEWGMNQTQDENPRLVVGVSLREIASDVFDWNTGNETTVDAAPNTNQPNPFNVRQPTSVSVVEELYDNGGTAKSRALVSWATAGKFVHEYEAQYKLSTDSTYQFALIVQSPPAAFNDVNSGTYDFRVRGLNSIGTRSDWTTLSNVTLAGLTANPSDVDNLSMIALSGNAHITWDLSTDLDVRIGGKVRFRHSSLTAGASWENSTDIGAAVAGHNTNTVLPLLSGTYMAKFTDSVGNQSIDATSYVITTVPSIVNMNAVANSTQHPSFAGAKTNMFATSDGVLKFEADQLIDSVTDLMDTWELLDSIGGLDTAGTYYFDTYLDLSATYTARTTADITFTAFTIGDKIDDRTTYMDTWSDFDNSPSDVNLDLYISTTTDDPSGTPTWSSWAKFTVADYHARAMKFKVQAYSTDADHQINITALSVDVDVPDRVQGAQGLQTGTGVKSVTYPHSFFAVPSVGITIVDGDINDLIEVTNETTTGFDISVKHGASYQDHKFNWQARGY